MIAVSDTSDLAIRWLYETIFRSNPFRFPSDTNKASPSSSLIIWSR